MTYPLRKFPEKNFKEIIEEVGPYNYCRYDKGEHIPGKIFKHKLDFLQFNCLVAGTGCTASDYTISFNNVLSENAEPEIIIPGGSPIMIARLFRYDNGHGEPHYNANDQLFFPSKSGEIFRMVRNDAPDHFINIANNSNINSIAEAFNLPEEKSGPVEQYSTKGAKLPINVVPLNAKKDKEK